MLDCPPGDFFIIILYVKVVKHYTIQCKTSKQGKMTSVYFNFFLLIARRDTVDSPWGLASDFSTLKVVISSSVVSPSGLH